jgi:hypothetical protein
MTHTIVLLVALMAANLTWLSDRLFYIIPLHNQNKRLAWCLFELIALYLIVGLISRYTEYMTLGNVSHQGWEFYTVTFCLFLVFSFPGFIYKILWSK